MPHRSGGEIASRSSSIHATINGTWYSLQSARAAANATWELLEQLRTARHQIQQVERLEPATPGDPLPSSESIRPEPATSVASRHAESVPIEAWLELGDGSAEQSEAIREAVGEIVQLQFLFVEALCRHFPALGSEIRSVAQHLFEDATRLVDPTCCQPPEGPLRRPLERMN